MNQEETIKLEREAFERRLAIRIMKNLDYAKNSEADMLSNFHEMAKMMETLKVDVTKSYGIAMYFMIHKIARLCNLMFIRKEAKNESLEDTFDDLAVYSDIAKELYHEKKD